MVLQTGTKGEQFQSIFIPREACSHPFTPILGLPNFSQGLGLVNDFVGGDSCVVTALEEPVTFVLDF